MAIQITNNNGIFEIKGNIIAENTKSIQHHVEQLLLHSDHVILSVDQVKKIDRYGVSILTAFYKKAMQLNKIFYIIGKENQVAKKAFGANSYVLRSDFV